MKVPEVLLSGNHEAIRKWRYEKALERTLKRRKDLLNKIKGDDKNG
jgi:tRNA (guanine37-N1)-methyltransferase